MTKDEALKMAIEALEMHVPHYIKDRGCEAINACKEALNHPAQPLRKTPQEKAECDCTEFYGKLCKCENQLNNEQLAKCHPYGYVDDEDIEFARAIEQALKEKNTWIKTKH